MSSLKVSGPRRGLAGPKGGSMDPTDPTQDLPMVTIKKNLCIISFNHLLIDSKAYLSDDLYLLLLGAFRA